MPFFLDESIPQCPACGKNFKTSQGLNCHLLTAKSCSWYCKGKIRELTLQDLEPQAPSPQPTSSDPAPLRPQDTQIMANEIPLEWDQWDSEVPDFWEDDPYVDIDPSEDIDQDELILLPSTSQPRAGPSTGPSEDPDDQ
ncbi:hypothetical protein CPB84DRAFT_1844074 [Gymnopilus junonius]|uniref:C2H2-type domain-containing protein n=1 Tax=Gymnopilus junonius TaxID=109634 RepID=A0A9P5NRW8_GYMJU|nr:hypothetical protein CPB84DRAFT_1844074 [Gymnopilus junonius]